MLQIRPYDRSDEDQVVSLWNRAGLIRPWNDPWLDIQRKQDVQADRFLVGVYQDSIVATAMVGYDGHRGWINYLAVDPDHRLRGFGRSIIDHAERLLHQAGCPKVNLQVRKDNTNAISFYKSIGYNEDNVVSYGKRLINDEVIYKIMSNADWNSATRDGVIRGFGIDLQDGFIHLSSRAQIADTLRRHFAGRSDLVLIRIDARKLSETLRWEPSRDGNLFPHVYGSIPLDAVDSVSEIDPME